MTIRDDIRATIFAAQNMKRAGIQTQFFGTTIEMRQATLAQLQEITDQRAASGGSYSLAKYLVSYAYVPGTDELVFEEGDLDTIAQMPYNKDMEAVAGIITQLSTIDVEASEKN